MTREFTIYTDGSCPKPGGPGGWASICLEDGTLNRGHGEPETTNNRMELMGVIGGIRALPEKSKVIVHCDSEYVVKGFMIWRHSWAKHGWPERVKNQDLWLLLIEEAKRHEKVVLVHVKGHDGNPHNEEADRVAGKHTKLQRRLVSSKA